LLIPPMLVGITLLSFIVSHAVPADPVTANLGDQAAANPEIVAAFKHRWGLDRPLPEQYGIYLWRVIHGDLGVSISTRQPVAVDALKHPILPAFVLSSYSLWIIARMMRGSMLEVLDDDYVRTARAKGLPRAAVLLRHAARNALIPVLTVVGLSFGGLLSGAVVTETVFAWPGLGSYAFQSSTSLDFPAIMGVGIVVAIVYTIVNLLVDVAYAMLDPRVRIGSRRRRG